MANPFTHVELHTADQAAAKKFYGELLDWKLQDMPIPGFGNYTMIEAKDGAPTAGIMQRMSPQVPSHWLTYIKVAKLEAAAKKAQQLGAKVLQPRTEVPGFGWFVVIQDPTGAAVGLYENANG
jgi:uncharacterized protein